MTFFHIDRDLTLRGYDEIKLFSNINTSDFIEFTNGISRHGVHYLNRDVISSGHTASCIWEFALEYIRKLNFPHLTSRFQCIFANTSIESAYKWIAEYVEDGIFDIVTVETENYFPYDSNLLKTTNADFSDFNLNGNHVNSFSSFCHFANKYWKGELSSDPSIEILIPLPCKIINRRTFQLVTNSFGKTLRPINE